MRLLAAALLLSSVPAAAALHKAGVQVAPWTVDDESGWDRMIALGVDAVITDDPGALIAHLKAKGLRR